ncbi:MAG TPA: SIS domain-containing protein [Anaerolineae bacterium]|nr:SIS domain-containing protein [Anaerolineae bacterium]
MSKKGYELFFEGVDAVLAEIRQTQGKNIEGAAKIIADAIISDNLLHVFGTGHSNCLSEEIFARAGTLVPINQVVDLSLAGSVGVMKSIFMERVEGLGEVIFNHLQPQMGDVFLVISNSGRNAAPIDFARTAKEHEHKVIVETNVEFSLSQTSRHSSGKRLLDYADVILDNKGPYADTILYEEGMGQRVGAASGIIGAYLIHATLVEAIYNIKEQGIEPPVFMYGNLDGSMETNQKLMEKYRDRIHNW